MADPIAFLTNSALAFVGGGDFILDNNDLTVLQGSLKVRIEALKDLLKTSYNDYYYFKTLGGNQDRFIGRGIDESLKTEVEEFTKNAIIQSYLFDSTEFSLYSIVDTNTIYIRLFIMEDTSEETVINLTYDSERGITLE